MRLHGERASARVPPARGATARAGTRGRDHRAGLRADAAADRVARDDRDGDRASRRSFGTREVRADAVAAESASPMGEGARLRPRARPRLARADDDRPAARNPERDDLRLRVGLAPAPTRLPGGDACRRPRRDPARPAREVHRRAAQAPPVPWTEGGVLPVGLRARPVRTHRLVDRRRARARRAASAARRLALPPAFESAVPADARASRPRGRRPRVRHPAHRRAAGLRQVARAAVGDRPRASGRCAKPDRVRRSRRLGRRDDEPRGGGARSAGLHDVRRAARRRRRAADPGRAAASAHGSAGARAREADERAGRPERRDPQLMLDLLLSARDERRSPKRLRRSARASPGRRR